MRYLSAGWLLLVVASVASAQEQHEVDRALGYTLADVLVSSGNYPTLELAPEQIQRIEELHVAFAQHYNDELGKSLQLNGKGFTGDILELAARQTPEAKTKLEAKRQAFETQLKDELLPSQVAIAEDILLRERFKQGGLKAVLASTDVPAVAEVSFDLKAQEIADRIDRATEKYRDELRKLEDELRGIVGAYKDKAEKIRKDSLDAALAELGPDGDKLKVILLQVQP